MTDELMAGAGPEYRAGEGAGVLLLHDLAGTPQPMHSLADALSKTGHSVEMPLLPGHGTSIEDLCATTWEDWAAAAQLALDELASRTGTVVVGGLALGATLACFVAALRPEVAGVIAINPRAIPVPEAATATMKAMLDDGCSTVQPLGPDVSDRTAHIVAYKTVPVATLISMFDAVNTMAGHWSELTSPMLIVTSARDHRVAPENGDWLAERVGGPVERLILERSFHEATVDVEHEKLEAAAADFVTRMTAAPTA